MAREGSDAGGGGAVAGGGARTFRRYVERYYSFDPDVEVELEQFEDVIGRHFRQPPEGLGNDDTSASHMWCTLRRPCNAL